MINYRVDQLQAGDITPEVVQEDGTLRYQVVYKRQVFAEYETRSEAEADLERGY